MLKTITSAALTTMAALGADQASASVSDSCRAELNGNNIVILVPHNAGGGRDRAARLIASVLKDEFGMDLRVENTTGMNGQIALRKVAKGVDGNTVFLGFHSVLTISTGIAMYPDSPSFKDFQPLMQFDLEYRAFGGTKEFDFFTAEPSELVVAPLGAFAMSELLGTFPTLNIKNIMGYSGASEALTAALRGDVDHTIFAAKYVAQQSTNNPGFNPALFMGPDSKNPWDDVPFFSGAGGLAEHLLSLAPQDRLEEYKRKLDLISTLAQDSFGFFIGSEVPENISDCISSTFDNLYEDKELGDSAENLGLSFSPLPSWGYREYYKKFARVIEEESETLRALIKN